MMQAGGFPPGEWSPLLVGHQWPSDGALAHLAYGMENREHTANAHTYLADLLSDAQPALAMQEGHTAEAIHRAFLEGEQLLREIAEKNFVKRDSHATALDSVRSLRHELYSLAENGNKEIKQILDSKEPAEIKVSQILAVISNYQQQANAAAAKYGANIIDAGQRILDQDSTGQSFHQLVGASQLFRSRDVDDLRPMVENMVSSSASSTGTSNAAAAKSGINPAPAGSTEGIDGIAGMPAAVNPPPSGAATATSGSPVTSLEAKSAGPGTPVGASSSPSKPAVAASFGKPGNQPAAPAPAAPPGPLPTSPGAPAAGGVPRGPDANLAATPAPGSAAPPTSAAVPRGPDANPVVASGLTSGGTQHPGGVPRGPDANLLPVSPTPLPSPAAPPVSSAPHSPPLLNPGLTGGGGVQMPSGPPSFSAPPATPPAGPTPSFVPTGLPHGLDSSPTAAPGANSFTPPPAPPVPPLIPTSPQTAPSAGVGDWHSPLPPEPPATPQTPAPAYTPAPPPPVSEPPVAPPPATNAAPATSTPPPAGPLPTYGSDVRPAASSAPAAPPSQPPSPSPPPTTPAAGSSGVAQGAAVRPAPGVTPLPAPSGFAGQAIASAVGGAAAGAVSADASARARLQRIVDAVARQQTRLAWAAGDRPDDTTVLVTDLASGWIPPGIDLPAAVTLLEPAPRRGDLQALLGEVNAVARYTPDHYIPEEDEPVPTSPRPRYAPEIEELGWELSHATHWRDGLPRLAHTLAKAASTGTGVLDNEVELLHEYLDAVSARVLNGYPDNVDAEEVGNWQLLAAIDALVSGDRSAANYHLAWFQATAAATAGHRRQP